MTEGATRSTQGEEPFRCGAPLLELERVVVMRSGRPVLNGLTLRIEQGESVAILGPNGSGKSTLIKLIDRELYPKADGGRMRILGRDRWHVAELRKTLGIVTNDLDSAIDPTLTSVDVVVAGFAGQLSVREADRKPEWVFAAHRALSQAGVSALDRQALYGCLSTGERRRVLIARALAHRPSTLLLDEPTSGLDLMGAHALMETLAALVEAGTSLILVTHHFEEIIPAVSRVLLMREGRIWRDGPREEVMTSERISSLYGHPIEVHGLGPYRAEVLPRPELAGQGAMTQREILDAARTRRVAGL